jgi:hypothetical protein
MAVNMTLTLARTETIGGTMALPPGFETTQQALEALHTDGADILVTTHHGLKIFCEELSTLKAMGLLRRRGHERAEIHARLAGMPRWLMIDDQDTTKPYPFDQLDELPEDATVWCTRHGRPVVWREWSDLACQLSVFSAHPAMIAWQVWLCSQYAPRGASTRLLQPGNPT